MDIDNALMLEYAFIKRRRSMGFEHTQCVLGELCGKPTVSSEATNCARTINWECQTLCSQAATHVVYVPHFVCGLDDAIDSGVHVPVSMCADCLTAGFLPLRSYQHTIEWNSMRGGVAPRVT